MKICTTCLSVFPDLMFYADKRRPGGLKSQCRACHIATSIRTRDKDRKRDANARHMRLSRLRDPERYRARDRARNRPADDRVKARRAVHAAIRSRKLIKPSLCSSCGASVSLTAHHTDYSKPLVVEWLCYPCHGKEHRHA